MQQVENMGAKNANFYGFLLIFSIPKSPALTKLPLLAYEPAARGGPPSDGYAALTNEKPRSERGLRGTKALI